MNCTKWAIVIAMAGGLTTAAAFADQPTHSFTPSAYEYGNYDYYNAAQQAAPAAPAPAAPAQAAPAAPAAPAPDAAAGSASCSDSNSCNAAAPACENSCNAAAPSCSNGCNSCSNGCGCDECCHEKLPHLLHCCCKLEPCFCWCDSCPLTCPDVTTYHLTDDCCCLKEKDTTLTGWISGGVMGNSESPASRFNGPTTFPDQDSGQLNQFYGVLQRTQADLSKNCGWWVGGDIDFLWGSDYFFTTAAGLDGRSQGNLPRWNTDPDQRYGFAMPQLYAETDYDDLRIKWGHFYTIIGYEVVPDIGNFFYTHSYTMQYGEPFTHTGVLASRNINDNWSWSAGLVAGWNDFTLQDGLNFLGGITYTDKDYGSLAFSIDTGDNSTANLPGIRPDANRTMYSLVWTRNLTSRLTYVFQHDLGVQQDAETLFGTRTADWYGINQYLFYKINCCWTLGWRAEWFRDQDGFAVTGLRPGNPLDGNFFAGNFYETAIGLNYKPNGNFTLRPEIRYDSYQSDSAAVGSQNPFDDNTKKNQFLFGLDAIYQF
jgi:hypothetical protein